MKIIDKIKHFFGTELWSSSDEKYNSKQLFLIRQARVLALAFRGFKEDEVLLRSSALTFYTLISIVPIIAMAFGIAKGFGFEEVLDKQIQSYFSSQPEVSEMLIQFSHSSLENTKGGLIAGIGIVLLFWSVMKVLNNIELSFNAVWGIKSPRTIVKKITEYLAIMIIAPIFMIAGGLGTVLASMMATHSISEGSYLALLGPALRILIEFIPYVLIWSLLTFVYMAIPNTRVKFKHALIAGVIAGSFFNLLEWAYFSFQIGAVQASAVYGSFAALPLFLVWVQSSWLVVLFGCEIAFSSQNVANYLYEKEINTISVGHKRKICLIILLHLNRKFNLGMDPLNENDLCKITKLPIRLIRTIMNELLYAGLIAESVSEKSEITYLPARDLNSLKYSEIIEIMDESGSSAVTVSDQKEWEVLNKIIIELRQQLIMEPSNMTLSDIENTLSAK